MTITFDLTARDTEIRAIKAKLATETNMSVRAALVARLFEIRR